MNMTFFILALIAMVGVLVSLGIGLLAMGQEGDEARRRSNKMMQFRVILQVLALVFLALAFMA